MKIRFVWIGKLKASYWKEAAAHYWQRLGQRYRLEEVCLRDGPAALSPAERTNTEGEDLLRRITAQDKIIGLDVQGRLVSSPELAELLRAWVEEPGHTPCFVIGGAYGLSEAVKSRADVTISLGRITLPHELARVVLLEQLYRADTILRGLPYHH